MSIEFPEYLQSLADESAIESLDCETIEQLLENALEKEQFDSDPDSDVVNISNKGADTFEARNNIIRRLITLNPNYDKKKLFQVAYLTGANDIALEMAGEDPQYFNDQFLVLFGTYNDLHRLINRTVNVKLVEKFKQYAQDPSNQKHCIEIFSNIFKDLQYGRRYGLGNNGYGVLRGFQEIITSWHKIDPNIRVPFKRSTQCGPKDIDTTISLFEVAYLFDLQDDVCISLISDDLDIQKEQLLVTLGSSVGVGARLGFEAHLNKHKVQQELVNRISKHNDAKEFFTHALRWYVLWPNDGGQSPTKDCSKTIAALVNAGADVNATGDTYQTDIIDLYQGREGDSTFAVASLFLSFFIDSWKLMLPYAEIPANAAESKFIYWIARSDPKVVSETRIALMAELVRISSMTEKKHQKKANDIMDLLIDTGLTFDNVSEVIKSVDGISEQDVQKAKTSIVEKIYNDEQKDRQRFLTYSLYSLILTPVGGIGLIMSAICAIIYLVKKYITASVKSKEMSWQSFEKIQPTLKSKENNLIVVNSVEPKKKPKDSELMRKFNYFSKLSGDAKLENDVRVYSFPAKV